MKTITDENLHNEHCDILIRQFVINTVEIVKSYPEENHKNHIDLARKILFDICTILDGSSYPGILNDKEIAPFIGFYIDCQTDNILVPEDGSSIHSYIDELIKEYIPSACQSKE